MNLINVLIQTIGGLGIFILGMRMMTDGLQMSAGDKIRRILGAVSSNRVIGCLTGTGVTAIIQSSSATTVMLIGFVSAGLMSLEQAVGVILGANIGTTMTAQLIAFKLSDAALPAIAIGVFLKFFTQKKKYRYVGEFVLGFGLLFFGLTVMSHGLGPIKKDPVFIAFFTRFNADDIGGILLCVFVGTVLTVLVQSSSATIGLTMALATQGLVTFPAAMALVLGENIGTTITAQLARLGSTNINAHRAANAHTIFNVMGVIIMIFIFPYFLDVVGFITRHMGTGSAETVVNGEAVNVARYIANGHTLFNVINAVIFLIFMPLLVKLSILLSPKPKGEEDIYRLPDFSLRLIDSPIAALTAVRSEIVRMSQTAAEMFKHMISCIEERDIKKLERWRSVEGFLDAMRKEITTYLTRLYQSEVSESEAKEISSLMRMANNIERIGDSTEDVAQLIEGFIENNMQFTAMAQEDLKKITGRVLMFLDLITSGIREGNPDIMEQALVIETSINDMRESMRQNHISRLRCGDCSIDPGLLYIDMLAHFEKMGGYCFNVAQAVAGVK
ncbi:MAG: Na/Pi cotransporter family protein [Desulfobacterales bacterium]|nr:Na/Pi cotransporter family protein [Desulfobacterales bacterium]